MAMAYLLFLSFSDYRQTLTAVEKFVAACDLVFFLLAGNMNVSFSLSNYVIIRLDGLPAYRANIPPPI